MRERDLFEARRAADARDWLRHPQRKVEDAEDRARREAADRRNGHVPACTLTRCHPDCTRRP